MVRTLLVIFCIFTEVAFVATLSAEAATVAAENKTEGYRDLIEKAYNLVLQKDRAQAMQLLNGAIKKFASNPNAVAEIKRTASEVGRTFYSEKAQQLHELSLSVRLTDPTQGLAKSSEALRIEPENLSVFLEQSRQQMAKLDCSAAKETLLRARKIYLYDEELNLSLAQAYLCDGNLKEYSALRLAVDSKKFNFAKNWTALDVEKLFREEQFDSAKTLATSLITLDSKYPEAYYWKFKVEKELKLDAKPSAQKYISLCKTLSHASFRLYMMDGFLCKRQPEVEAALKAAPSASE